MIFLSVFFCISGSVSVDAVSPCGVPLPSHAWCSLVSQWPLCLLPCFPIASDPHSLLYCGHFYKRGLFPLESRAPSVPRGSIPVVVSQSSVRSCASCCLRRPHCPCGLSSWCATTEAANNSKDVLESKYFTVLRPYINIYIVINYILLILPWSQVFSRVGFFLGGSRAVNK